MNITNWPKFKIGDIIEAIITSPANGITIGKDMK